MNKVRYVLGIILPGGQRWFVARESSRTGPRHTAEPRLAMDFESVAAVREWLDSVPEEVMVKGQPVPGGRKWMRGLRFKAVEVTVVVGDSIELAAVERIPASEVLLGQN